MFANFNIEDNQFMKMMLEAARNDSTVKLPTEILVSIGKDGGNAYTGGWIIYPPISTYRPVP